MRALVVRGGDDQGPELLAPLDVPEHAQLLKTAQLAGLRRGAGQKAIAGELYRPTVMSLVAEPLGMLTSSSCFLLSPTSTGVRIDSAH